MENTKQERLLEIFFRALRGEGLSVQKLADEYEVSTKSIGRKIKQIRTFENLIYHIRVRGRKHSRKMIHTFTRTFQQPTFNLHIKHCFAPTIFYCFLRVPYAAILICQLIHQRNIASPRNLCNDPLHDCIVRPALGKFSHIFDISWRKSRHFRKSILYVF